jgi:ribonuclease III
MSRPRLHDSLVNLFESRNHSLLQNCIQHDAYAEFLRLHELQIPLESLVIAFTHTSFSHEYQVPHQELLEFLGDAILQLIVTDEICRLYPEEKEGQLSKLRSSVVNEKTLARLAQALKLNELLLVGKGEYKKALQEQETVLADTMEALLCLIYRHQGYEVARSKLLAWFHQHLAEVFDIKVLLDFDAKSKLQEATLAKYKTLPRYSADSTNEGFLVKVWINEKVMAEGIYSSKKIGERELAQKILKDKSF